MAFDQLTTEFFINDIKDTLGNADAKFCFILGAGASVESGILSGGTLANKWYSELGNHHTSEEIEQWKTDVAFDEKNVAAFYSQLFSFRYKRNMDAGINYINSVIEKGSPGFGYSVLSQVLDLTHHNVVITTNFDTLTEEALYIYTNKRALICNHENLAHLAKPRTARPLIVKIHRGLYLDPLNAPEEIQAIKPEWEKSLSKIFSEYIPIVIGYGGNDGSLMNYLQEIKSCTRMYWCIQGGFIPSEAIVTVVKKHNGSFVQIEGFNRLMFRFIGLFKVGLPNDLEQLAKERYEKLRKELEEASKIIEESGTTQEKEELGKIASDFDVNDWLQWDLKAKAAINGQETEAIYIQAINLLPKSYQLLNNYGVWLYDKNHFDKAIECYQKAIEIKPDYAAAWNNMGVAYRAKGDNDKAIECYQKAIEIKPDYAAAWYNMGVAYGYKGDNDKANACYQKAIEINAKVGKPRS